MINNVSPGFIPSTPTVNPAATPSSGATSGTSSASASSSKKAELEFSPGRNSAKDYSAVQQSLAKGKGAVESAQAATTDIKDSLVKVREVATKLADDSLAAPQREKLQKEYSALRSGIEKSLEGASYKGADGGKGVNLLTDKDSTIECLNQRIKVLEDQLTEVLGQMTINITKDLRITAKNITEDADTIKLNGGSAVVTCAHICHFTGAPHGDGSSTVSAGK